MDTIIRGLAVYAVLLMVTRLAGRRTLAQATPFDFVLLLIIAETTQQALLGDDFSITNSVLLIISLFTANIMMAFIKSRSSKLALWLDGAPTVLMSRGRIDPDTLVRARISVDDILTAAREQHGIARLDGIDAAILEVSGGISIIPKPDA